jgi:hypothetical protein
MQLRTPAKHNWEQQVTHTTSLTQQLIKQAFVNNCPRRNQSQHSIHSTGPHYPVCLEVFMLFLGVSPASKLLFLLPRANLWEAATAGCSGASAFSGTFSGLDNFVRLLGRANQDTESHHVHIVNCYVQTTACHKQFIANWSNYAARRQDWEC